MYQKFYNSPIGQLKIVCDDFSVLEILPVSKLGVNNQNEICDLVETKLISYFNKELKKINLPITLNGTNFQKQVWQELLNIPYGQTISYQELANKIGKPKAVRAVANSVGKNKCLVLIPCHRVIGTNKTLTGFSAGLEGKIKLLKLEGHKVKIKEDLKSSLIT